MSTGIYDFLCMEHLFTGTLKKGGLERQNYVMFSCEGTKRQCLQAVSGFEPRSLCLIPHKKHPDEAEAVKILSQKRR